MGNCDTYRAHVLRKFPQEYAEVIATQKVARHEAVLVYTALYDEIINTIMEQHAQLDAGFWQNLVRNQIDQLNRPAVSRALNSTYDYALHMGADQYNAYSIVTQFLGGTHSHNAQKLFFITGSAGVGKSFILSALETWIKERRMKYLKLAPTGIAAINIEGRTIHSALSMASNNNSSYSTQFNTSIFNSEEKQQALREISVILIDEISMVSAEMLSYVSSMFGRLHGNGRPFGGIAVLAFGDLLQLPPVVGQPVFYANLWRLFCPLFLLHSHRQENDAEWFRLLNLIRVGDITEEVWNTLVEIHGRFSMGEVLPCATFIVSLRKYAHQINTAILEHIPSEPKVNYAVDRGETGELLSLEQTSSSFKKETNLPDAVDIKVGARVMFLDNSLFASGISNGTTGVVIDHFAEDGHPKVAFPTPQGVEVSMFTFVSDRADCPCDVGNSIFGYEWSPLFSYTVPARKCVRSYHPQNTEFGTRPYLC
jgi:hypothetical protein